MDWPSHPCHVPSSVYTNHPQTARCDALLQRGLHTSQNDAAPSVWASKRKQVSSLAEWCVGRCVAGFSCLTDPSGAEFLLLTGDTPAVVFAGLNRPFRFNILILWQLPSRIPADQGTLVVAAHRARAFSMTSPLQAVLALRQRHLGPTPTAFQQYFVSVLRCLDHASFLSQRRLGFMPGLALRQGCQRLRLSGGGSLSLASGFDFPGVYVLCHAIKSKRVDVFKERI